MIWELSARESQNRIQRNAGDVRNVRLKKAVLYTFRKLVDGKLTLILKNVSIADAAKENVLSAQYRNIKMVIKSISEAAGVSESHTVRLLPEFSQRKKK